MDQPKKIKAVDERSESFLGVRIPTAVHDRFRELAEYHGRSVSEEVKWAMVMFDAQATLAELQHPEALAEMGPEAHAAAVADVSSDLRNFTVAALAPPKESNEPALL